MALRWVLANGYSNWDLSAGWFKRKSTGNPIFHRKIHGLVVYNPTRSNQLANPMTQSCSSKSNSNDESNKNNNNHDYVFLKYQDGHAASIYE